MVYTRIVQPGQRKQYAYGQGDTLLFRISGTLVPEVWLRAVLSAVLTLLMCWAYDPLRRNETESLSRVGRKILNYFHDMERLLQYLTGFLTFILGFFNSIAFNRWWHMRELCGDIIEASQNTATQVSVFFVKAPSGAEGNSSLHHARKDLLRLLVLGQALAMQACHRVRDHDWLIDRGLLARGGEEHKALQRLPGPGFRVVYAWYVVKAYKYASEGMMDEQWQGSVLYLMRWSLCHASNNADDLMMHLNQQIPLAYCHILELMVTIYVVITPMALVPSLLWSAVLVAPIVTLFFHGFFKLGTSMLMDPFQKDSGFDTSSFLSSNLFTMESLARNVPL